MKPFRLRFLSFRSESSWNFNWCLWPKIKEGKTFAAAHRHQHTSGVVSRHANPHRTRQTRLPRVKSTNKKDEAGVRWIVYQGGKANSASAEKVWIHFTAAMNWACESHLRFAFTTCSDSEITATPILDNPHLILLFYLTQLFLRELVRSYHLLKIIPMDMSGYFGECCNL